MTSGSNAFAVRPVTRRTDARTIGQRGNPAAFAGGVRRVEVIDGPFPLQPTGKSARIAGEQHFLSRPSQ